MEDAIDTTELTPMQNRIRELVGEPYEATTQGALEYLAWNPYFWFIVSLLLTIFICFLIQLCDRKCECCQTSFEDDCKLH